MPKRFMLALAVLALAIAACHNGSVTPTPSSSPASPVPNPSIMHAVILVTVKGTPQAKVPVEESTPKSKSSPRPGRPFDTQLTGKKGLVHFHDLKPSKTYCWVAIIAKGIKSSECAGWQVWQSGEIDLGT